MSTPTIITHFPGQKVEQYLRLMGVLPGEFDDAEVVASARRIITLIEKGYPDERGKPHRAKASTLYRVLSAFLAIAESAPPGADASGEKAGLTQAAEGSELLRLKSLNAELREGLEGLLDAYFGLAAVGTERAARMNAAERVARSLLSRTT